MSHTFRCDINLYWKRKPKERQDSRVKWIFKVRSEIRSHACYFVLHLNRNLEQFEDSKQILSTFSTYWLQNLPLHLRRHEISHLQSTICTILYPMDDSDRLGNWWHTSTFRKGCLSVGGRGFGGTNVCEGAVGSQPLCDHLWCKRATMCWDGAAISKA